MGDDNDQNWFEKAGDFLSSPAGAGIAAGIGGLFGLYGGGGDTQGSQGYTGGIPEYTAKRTPLLKRFNPAYGGQRDPTTYNPYGSNAPDTPPVYTELEGARRPGQFGRRYFTDMKYTPKTDAEGNQTVMGGDYLAQLNADALTRQQNRQSDLDNLIQFLIANQMAGQTPIISGTTDDGTTDDGTTKPTVTDEQIYWTLLDRYQFPGSYGGDRGSADTFSGEDVESAVRLMAENGVSPERVAEVMKIPLAKVQRAYTKFGFAQGGLASLPQSRGYYLGGPTDGMADKVPATIDGREPARLSDGEFVIPADVVSHLGNGNSDAGANQLYSMMDRVRKARTGNTRQGKQINPNKYLA